MFFNRSIIPFLVSTILISSMAPSTTAADSPQALLIARSEQINFDKISIGGIKYNMAEQIVFNKLGKPQKTEQIKLCYGAVEKLTYPGMTVDIQKIQKQKRVVGIEVTSPNLGIDQVVKVGDSIDKAKKAYASNFFQVDGKENQWFARPKYSEVFLAFAVNKAGKITKISVGVDC
jgi:hypothetical protein